MGSKWTGVALATVLGACTLAGGASQASAALILDAEFNSNGDVSGGYASLDLSVHVDTRGNFLTYNYIYEKTITYTTPEQNLTETGKGYQQADIEYGYGFDYQNQVPAFFFSFSSDRVVGGITYDIYDGVFVLQNGSAALSNHPAGNPGEFSATLYQVSDVPLPASASLFGCALLALGGIGYMGARSKAQAA